MIEVVLLLPIRREVCLMPTKGQRQRQLQNVWDVVPMGNGGKMPVLWGCQLTRLLVFDYDGRLRKRRERISPSPCIINHHHQTQTSTQPHPACIMLALLITITINSSTSTSTSTKVFAATLLLKHSAHHAARGCPWRRGCAQKQHR